jgi:antitoxin StbD
VFTKELVAVMTSEVLTEISASIADLQKNPMAVVGQGEGSPVVILDQDQPAFYCVPTAVYEALMDKLEDIELNAIADQREAEPFREVSLDDL